MTNQFREYDDVERLGKDEVEGILNGTVYVFEKIDGANVSLYWNEENGLVICSRNNVIYSDKFEGNFRGIVEYIKANPNIEEMLKANQSCIFYGERLVKHTISYPPEFANKIWFFDIYSRSMLRYLNWEETETLLKSYGVNYIPCLATLENPLPQDTCLFLDVNKFQGKPRQEGIVIKNYQFVNKYGRQQWAKIVNEQYKEVKREPKDKEAIEIKLTQRYVTEARVEKMMNKICDEKSYIATCESCKEDICGNNNDDTCNARNSIYKCSEKDTPQVLNRVWNDVIQEEIWDILRKEKNPTINFRIFKKECDNISRSLFFAKLSKDRGL